MKYNILALFTSVFLFGACTAITTKPTTSSVATTSRIVTTIEEAKVGDVIVDVSNNTYRKVTNKKTSNFGVEEFELWERISPQDTNRWFSPTLSSFKNKASAPVFNGFSR
jgi:hypothetical protein